MDGQIHSIAVQGNGQLLIGGQFNTVYPNGNSSNPISRQNIARLNADGSVDPNFDPKTNSFTAVRAIVIQPDGDIVLSGTFSSLQPNGAALPTTRNKIARIHADGTLDMGFDPNVNNRVNCVALQPDGKILIGGPFDELRPNGAASATRRYYMARLNADGTLDMTFDPNPNADVNSISIQPDGKILVGGNFANFQTKPDNIYTARSRMVRSAPALAITSRVWMPAAHWIPFLSPIPTVQ